MLMFFFILSPLFLFLFLFPFLFLFLPGQVRAGGNPALGDPPPEGGGRHVEDARQGAVPAVQCGGDERPPRGVPPPSAVHGLRGTSGQLPGVRRAHRRGGEDVQHLTGFFGLACFLLSSILDLPGLAVLSTGPGGGCWFG